MLNHLDQLDSFVLDNIPVLHHCHCRSKNIAQEHQIIEHSLICKECAERKQPLLKGSIKSNSKRFIKELKKKAQKKR